jgi:hypothetical protein
MSEDEELRRQTDELVRLYGELLRRLSHQGVRGVPELVALHEQVCRAVGAIGHEEIDWALTQIASVLDKLRAIGQRLNALREIKRVFSEV